jgi:hypothetical protein
MSCSVTLILVSLNSDSPKYVWEIKLTNDFTKVSYSSSFKKQILFDSTQNSNSSGSIGLDIYEKKFSIVIWRIID